MNACFYNFDKFSLDAQARQLIFKNESVNLSSKAFDILLYLVVNHGKIVTKEELFRSVWANSFVEENNLPVHISALRRSLGEKRGDSRFIKTVSGRGYSFIAPVEEIKKTSFANIAISAKTVRSNAESESFDALNSIAVLPFEFEKENADFEYLASGITQSLIDNLSQIPKLKVMAYTAVKNYRKSELGLQEIGFQLGVGKILYGTLTEYKNSLEITVELINATDKSYLWGTQYNCRFADVFAVKREISLAIAEKLKLRLSEFDKANLAETEVSDSDAYKFFLKANAIMDDFPSHQDRRKRLSSALSLFRQAIKKDQQFAPAYVGVGKVYFFLFYNKLISRSEALTECRAALRAALDLNPRLSEAFVLEGMLQVFVEFDFKKAENFYGKAIELNGNNAYAYHMQSLLSIVLGRFDEAIRLQNEAIRLDPTSTAYNCGLINRFYFTENYRQAIVQAEETLELDERSGPAYLVLALAYAQSGFYREAIESSQKAVDNLPTDEAVLAQSYVYALAGQKSKARNLLRKILSRVNLQTEDFTYVAAVYAALGESESAFESLEKAFGEKSVEAYLTDVDPRFSRLRRSPQFISLRRKLD